MLIHPNFDPIAVQIGPLAVHWYGLTYLVAFALFYALARVRIGQQPFSTVSAPGPWQARDVEDLLFMGVMGAIVGGRLGYCLFYKPDYYASHLLEVFAVWKGGMSFHGGMLGTIAALGLFARLRGRRFWEVADLVAPCVPTGLAAGRLGNFINGELWGRAADPSLPWAMVFPHADKVARHPSQLYQLLMEGLLLFVLLWLYARKPRGLGQVSGAFLFGYGVFRFVAEYFREPDDFLGLLALNLSMGQWLCVPMIVVGALIWAWGARQPKLY
jgi:phosphatidylglycerol:prolipoprotein diacylglycerol transferase